MQFKAIRSLIDLAPILADHAPAHIRADLGPLISKARREMHAAESEFAQLSNEYEDAIQQAKQAPDYAVVRSAYDQHGRKLIERTFEILEFHVSMDAALRAAVEHRHAATDNDDVYFVSYYVLDLRTALAKDERFNGQPTRTARWSS